MRWPWSKVIIGPKHSGGLDDYGMEFFECPNCDAFIDENANYCGCCGKKIKWVEPKENL